ncbi:DUF5983 family protein [Sphingobium sp. TCM1]|uniref:DUF5983 family protein n=1 Tax=Sphingobium sp. TCM1 TaxID=453246 RepID=UPI0007F3A85F|nr:hypothetical protein [Sphingobium sp. TCM1]OAN53503.1 hypothetical protein A7Q26_05655 [Sphingobium sp. TCM1]
MRRSALIVCSTIHLPVAERRHIDGLIATAPRGADSRVEVGHTDLVIEPYAYGFFVHTCLVGCGSERPDDVSVEFWAILTRAFDSDVSWVLFDRDEPLSPDLPVFPDLERPEEHSS